MSDSCHGDNVAANNRLPFLRQLYGVSGIMFNIISTGCIVGYPAVLLPQLRLPDSTIQVTPDSESWIASIVGFAIMSGNFLVPYLMKLFGRRLSNLLSVLPALAGWGFILIADNITMLIFARYLQGFAMGLQGSLSSVTIAEYSSPAYRGGFLGTVGFSMATGIMLCHIFGSFWTWKTTALASASFHVMSMIVISTSPESPAWLASKGKYEKCRKTFFWLRGEEEGEIREVELMINNQIMQRNVREKKLKVDFKSWLKRLIDIFKKKEFYKPLLIMIIMFTLLQFSGSTAIPAYSVTFMTAVTGESVNPYTGMLVMDFVRFIASILSVFVLRTFDRRSVLFFSATFSTLTLATTSAYLYFRDIGLITLEHNWIPITSMLLYVFVLTIGVYILPWAILGEIFPLDYKSLGSGVSGLFLSTMFFTVLKSTPFMFLSIGVHGIFAVFAGFIMSCSMILYFILPETKGRTLQEIEDDFKGIEQINLEKREQNTRLKHCDE